MPQRKGRQNNKKKGKGKGGQGPGPKRPPGWTPRPISSSASGNEFIRSTSGELPNLDNLANRRRQMLHEGLPSVYSRYKDATNRFVKFLLGNTPESVPGNRNSVDFLITAAEWMEENRFLIEKAVLVHLKLAIRMRARVAKSVYGGGDKGHRHFLLVLQYCWQILSALPKTSTSTSTKQAQETKDMEEDNRYAAFMSEDDELSDEADEEAFPKTPVPRPSMDANATPLTLDQLLRSDERNDAVLFLFTLDEIMGYISDQYKSVTKNVMENKRIGVPESNIVEMLLESGVSTNMAIQQVQQLEMDLQAQYPHLTTPYRVLSTIVFPEITEQVAQIVREYGSIESSSSGLEKETICFLGDCLECHIRSPSDPHSKKKSVVRDFCSSFKISGAGVSELNRIFTGLGHVCVNEIPVGAEQQQAARLQRSEPHVFPPSHSWLPEMQFIGGKRAIHHTLRLLQAFGPVISNNKDNQKITPIGGMFGPSPWRPGRARTIHNDLDELFMADILPDLVMLAKKGILGKARFPGEEELYPLFILLRQYVQNPSAPVSWSFTFAMHAMVTAVFETESVFNQLLDISSRLFENFFAQINKASKSLAKEESTEMLKNRVFGQNLIVLSYLQNFGNDVFGKRAIWNPLCSGTIFSFLNFFGNMEAGCAIIDSQAQLRITLHLFNALRERGLLRQGDAPFLEIIDQCFSSSRGVWEGQPPKRGEFVQRFWMCFGSSIAHSKKMAEESKLAVLERKLGNAMDSKSWSKRKMNPVEPAEISKSFRRVCNRDFHDVVDKYHTEEQRKRSKGTDIYAFAVRANDTLDAIDEEQLLFSFNLPVLSMMMEQFVCSLARVLQWEPWLKSAGASLMDDRIRQGFVVLYCQHLLGALDYADDLSTHTFMNVPLAEATTEFMKMFFNSMSRDLVTWFQAVREAED